MTFEILYDISFWIVIGGSATALIWDLISGPQKKFWGYKRANKKVSRFPGSCNNGQV